MKPIAANIIEKHHQYFEYFGVCMSILMMYKFIIAWVYPENIGSEVVYDLTLLFTLEMLMVHSGTFMALLPKKLSLYVLVPFYGVFVWALNRASVNTNLLLIYGIIIFNRMRFAFTDSDFKIRVHNFVFSVVALLIYIALFFFTLKIEDYIPRAGLTENFLAISGYTEVVRASGFSGNEEPHTFFFTAIIYYLCLTVLSAYTSKKKFVISNIKPEDFTF